MWIDFLAKELVNNNYNPAARYTSGIEAAFFNWEISFKDCIYFRGQKQKKLLLHQEQTESINTALKGIVFAPNPKHKRILSSSGEHPATTETLKFIEKQLGYTIDYCPLNNQGVVEWIN